MFPHSKAMTSRHRLTAPGAVAAGVPISVIAHQGGVNPVHCAGSRIPATSERAVPSIQNRVSKATAGPPASVEGTTVQVMGEITWSAAAWVINSYSRAACTRAGLDRAFLKMSRRAMDRDWSERVP